MRARAPTSTLTPHPDVPPLLLLGGKVPEVDLGPILYKRLHIEGSTLRSRSAAYQADLIAEYVAPTRAHRGRRASAGICVWRRAHRMHRFQARILGEITGSTGGGKIRTYIHEVFPFEGIQDAHRTMEADANACVVPFVLPARCR